MTTPACDPATAVEVVDALELMHDALEQAACVIAGSGLATEHAQAEWRCFHEGTTEERLSLAGRHPDPSQGHSEGTRGIEVAPESEMVGWSQAAAEDCGRGKHTQADESSDRQSGGM